MSNRRNKSGMQLSSSNWLESHHAAKKKLRFEFAKKISEHNPKSIVDIGCGTGLWLSIFNDILPKECKFIGVDSDEESLAEAKRKSANWERECEWISLDINKDSDKIPSADLALVFNFSSYIKNLDLFFLNISRERGFKEIALRQFAGDEIKFGPFMTDEHTRIDLSLKASMGGSSQIKYFDMDRLIEAAAVSGREAIFKNFELFSDFSPFNESTWPYIKGTAEWTAERVSEKEQVIIKEWINKALCQDNSLYFYSLDWLALLV